MYKLGQEGQMSQENPVSIGRLILVPALITLGVTILRLAGELLHWSKLLFNPDPGGGMAPIGISWLPIVFGIYFALKLAGAGARPASLGRAFGFTALGLLVMVAGGYLFGTSQFSGAKLAAGCVLIAVSAITPLLGWPSLGKTLLAYAYAARIPVVIIMFFAIQGSWGTHYDGPPPDFPEMGFLPKFFLIGFLPQMILWIAFTVIVGSLVGAITAAIARRGRSVAPAT
jgi:hypothetical protein